MPMLMGLWLGLFAALQAPVAPAALPAEYQEVLTFLSRQGDFADGVFRVNIPRSDLQVTVAGVPTPTPFAFGGWLAMAKGNTEMNVMMGDLVLLQNEVGPVMSALLDNGVEVTALHNHFFWDEPRLAYMHVHGHGTPMALARMVKPALDLIGKNVPPAAAQPAAEAPSLNTTRLAQIVGAQGVQTGGVYKITLGRPDLHIQEMGVPISSRMGLNTWAAFVGTDAKAAIAGDVAMLAREVTPVLKALRANGLEVVAIHHHMTSTDPPVYFLHYWGIGPADRLATGFRAALDQTGN